MLKLNNNVTSYLDLIYNGFKKKLFIFEKDKFDNGIVLDVEQAMKAVEGNWMISFGFWS